jgi:hypothetical protein
MHVLALEVLMYYIEVGTFAHELMLLRYYQLNT